MGVIFSTDFIAYTSQGSSDTSLHFNCGTIGQIIFLAIVNFWDIICLQKDAQEKKKVPYWYLLCTDVSARFTGGAQKLKPNKEHNFSIYNKQKLKQMSLIEVMK